MLKIVEDKENKINTVLDKVEEINEVKNVQENEDGTVQYIIEGKEDADLRKKVFAELAKEQITILEMKKADTTLEDVFIELIEGGNK